MISLIRRAIDRLRNEPVLLLTALIIGLTAFQGAMQAGLSMDDAVLAVLQAIVGYAMRELVYGPQTHEAEVQMAGVAGFDAGVAEVRSGRMD